MANGCPILGRRERSRFDGYEMVFLLHYFTELVLELHVLTHVKGKNVDLCNDGYQADRVSVSVENF